jgi:protein-tyrosine-phosphatase
MIEPMSRKSDPLRRILFLCRDNHYEGRFCEELFNSHARTEGLNWHASSRGLMPNAAARNDGPMSAAAIAYLRALGAAPVNHLRLPLHATDFDFQMSYTVVALGREWAAEIERRWPYYASQVELWPLPAVADAQPAALLRHLTCEMRSFVAALQGQPQPWPLFDSTPLATTQLA